MFELALILVGIVCAVMSAAFFSVHVIFHKYPHLTKATGATLLDYEHKSNVKIYGRGKTFFVKDMTKGFYYYEANDRFYKVRYTNYFSKKASKSLPVVYVKRFPRFSYVNKIESLSKDRYLYLGLLALFFAFCLIFLGIVSLTK